MYFKDLPETNDDKKVQDSTHRLVGRGNISAVAEARTTTTEVGEEALVRRPRMGSRRRRGSVTIYSLDLQETVLTAGLATLTLDSEDPVNEEEESESFPSVKPASESDCSQRPCYDDDEPVRVGISDDNRHHCDCAKSSK